MLLTINKPSGLVTILDKMIFPFEYVQYWEMNPEPRAYQVSTPYAEMEAGSTPYAEMEAGTLLPFTIIYILSEILQLFILMFVYEQLMGIGSLLQLYWTWGSNSNLWAWQHNVT